MSEKFNLTPRPLVVDTEDEQIVFSTSGYHYTRREVTLWMDMVQDKDNWKNPIDTLVYLPTERDKFALVGAIMFFTGSVSNLIPLSYGHYRVKADGYYISSGA